MNVMIPKCNPRRNFRKIDNNVGMPGVDLSFRRWSTKSRLPAYRGSPIYPSLIMQLLKHAGTRPIHDNRFKRKLREINNQVSCETRIIINFNKKYVNKIIDSKAC